MRIGRLTTIVAFVYGGCVVRAAEAQRAMSVDDYARAERFMYYNTLPLVSVPADPPEWVGDDRLWYRTWPDGSQLVLVDARQRTKTNLLADARIVANLRPLLGAATDSLGEEHADIALAKDGRNLTISIGGKRVRCEVETGSCVAEPPPDRRDGGPRRPPEHLSPDGRRAAFIRDWNLWMRDLAIGAEVQLTRDGTKDNGYATDNAGWLFSDRAILRWSPDSRKIATFQLDQRGVGEMYLVSTRIGHPLLRTWKYAMAGDSIVPMVRRVIIDVGGTAPRVVPLLIAPDHHRSTLCDDFACDGEPWGDVEWYPDGSHLAFVSTSRDHKHVVLRVANASTGAIRDVLEETVATHFQSGADPADASTATAADINWRVLPSSNEVIWYSERDNWGRLYLYDLSTGRLKRRITSGDGNVARLVRVDEAGRTLFVLGNGGERGRDPYFHFLYRIGMDGGDPALLTPENADHEISVSPSGRYFADQYSRPETPPTFVVRDMSGRVVQTVFESDLTRLVAAGWKPPRSITVKARDGTTDLYGLMFTPTNLDSTKKYPIINHIYPGPQVGSVGSRAFAPSRGDAQALAELGFVVVEIDGMGTAGRSKAFHDVYYGNMGDATLPDQIAGMRELARRYPWIDITRVGIYGHSGGGGATADAMFRYPDFFNVGVAESGNHDNRAYEDDWGERYQGLEQRRADGTSSYDDQANQNIAKNLRGKLLLVHGTMDRNVPPYHTLLVAQALIEANKDFDLLILPNQGHSYGAVSLYATRRRWDYFVKNLLGLEPPKDVALGPKAPFRR